MAFLGVLAGIQTPGPTVDLALSSPAQPPGVLVSANGHVQGQTLASPSGVLTVRTVGPERGALELKSALTRPGQGRRRSREGASRLGAPRAPMPQASQRPDSAPPCPGRARPQSSRAAAQRTGAGSGPEGGGALGGGVEAGRPGPASLGSSPPAGSRDARRSARVTSTRAADSGDMASERDVRARLQRAGQEHLLRFCAELAPGPRAALLAELGALEPEALREHCRRAAAACAHPPGPPPDLAARLRPLPPECVGSASRCDPEMRRLWEEEGRRGGAGVPGGAGLAGGGGPAPSGGTGEVVLGGV